MVFSMNIAQNSMSDPAEFVFNVGMRRSLI
jgi:hypothetical protein